jgi:hypothetical protein
MRSRVFTCLLCLLLPLHAFAAIALVQKTANTASGSTTITLTLNSVAAGDLVVAMVDYDHGVLPTGATDSSGQTPQQATSADNTSAGIGQAIYYVPDAAAGTHTITITIASGSGVYTDGFIAEYSGVAITSPLDANPTPNQGSSTTISTPTATPSQSGDLAIAYGDVAVVVSLSGWSAGFTQEGILSSSGDSTGAWADSILSGTVPLSVSVTASAGAANIGSLVLFKAAPSLTPHPVMSGGHVLMSNGHPVIG